MDGNTITGCDAGQAFLLEGIPEEKTGFVRSAEDKDENCDRINRSHINRTLLWNQTGNDSELFRSKQYLKKRFVER